MCVLHLSDNYCNINVLSDGKPENGNPSLFLAFFIKKADFRIDSKVTLGIIVKSPRIENAVTKMHASLKEDYNLEKEVRRHLTEKMKAAVITEVGKCEIREVEKPVPGPGEVLIQNKACALCTWETRVFFGIKKREFPYVEGHEVSGIVAGKGAGVSDDFAIGERVIVRKFYSCGRCYYCKKGLETQCLNVANDPNEERFEANGGFCEYMVVPESDLFKCSQELPFEVTALAEPLSCVVHSIDRAGVDLGDDVLIIGAGIMGILHLQLAKLKGARVIVCEIDEKKRKLAKKLGADVVFDPGEHDTVDYVRSLTDGRGADVVFNLASSAAVSQISLQAVAPGGRIIAYSSQHPDTPVGVPFGDLHNREYGIIGAVSPTVRDFQRAAKLISMNAVDLKAVIEKTFPFEKCQEAFDSAVPGTYRMVLKIGE